jgi:hypothetical protein
MSPRGYEGNTTQREERATDHHRVGNNPDDPGGLRLPARLAEPFIVDEPRAARDVAAIAPMYRPATNVTAARATASIPKATRRSVTSIHPWCPAAGGNPLPPRYGPTASGNSGLVSSRPIRERKAPARVQVARCVGISPVGSSAQTMRRGSAVPARQGAWPDVTLLTIASALGRHIRATPTAPVGARYGAARWLLRSLVDPLFVGSVDGHGGARRGVDVNRVDPQHPPDHHRRTRERSKVRRAETC